MNLSLQIWTVRTITAILMASVLIAATTVFEEYPLVPSQFRGEKNTKSPPHMNLPLSTDNPPTTNLLQIVKASWPGGPEETPFRDWIESERNLKFW